MLIKLRWRRIFVFCNIPKVGETVTDEERDLWFASYGIKVRDRFVYDKVIDEEKFSLFMLEYTDMIEEVNVDKEREYDSY